MERAHSIRLVMRTHFFHEKHISFTSEQPKKYNLWPCQKFCDILHYLLDNKFSRYGSKLYRQIVGIPIGTNCAPLIADFLCFVMRLHAVSLTIIKLMLMKHL